MSQPFFKNNIESKFIKNLLLNSRIPTCKLVTTGDLLLSGNTYIYNGRTILCTYSGYLYESSDLNIDNKTVCGYTITDAPITYKNGYNSKRNYYDADTHKALGDYLRAYKKTSGIDLMPYYNCFNYFEAEDFYLTDNGYKFGRNSFYRVFLVPIKFNASYNIYLDSISQIFIKPVIYSDFGMTTLQQESLEYLTDIIGVDTKVYSGSQFSKPIKFSVSNDFINDVGGNEKSKLLEAHEDELYLALQVISTNKSSIVVIEGDYYKYDFASNGMYLSGGDFYRTDDSIIYCSNPGIYNKPVLSKPLINVLGSNEGALASDDGVVTNTDKNLFNVDALIEYFGESNISIEDGHCCLKIQPEQGSSKVELDLSVLEVGKTYIFNLYAKTNAGEVSLSFIDANFSVVGGLASGENKVSDSNLVMDYNPGGTDIDTSFGLSSLYITPTSQDSKLVFTYGSGATGLYVDITSLSIFDTSIDGGKNIYPYLYYPEDRYTDLYNFQGIYARYFRELSRIDINSFKTTVTYPTFMAERDYKFGDIVCVGGLVTHLYVLLDSVSANSTVDLRDTTISMPIYIGNLNYVDAITDSVFPLLAKIQSDAYTQDVDMVGGLMTKPSLTVANTGITYAFSDRLLEYLLLNSVTYVDTISKNLKIPYRCLGEEEHEYISNMFPLKIFNDFVSNPANSNASDISGNIDKDVERYYINKINNITNSEWVSGN